MRNLPVEKIWGAGSKTQEIFRAHSQKTGEDIYRLSLNVLTSLFGKAFGLFLYRAVRGEGTAEFDEDRGSHSMSVERAFPYDLLDAFAIETVLLDICRTLPRRCPAPRPFLACGSPGAVNVPVRI